MKHIPNILTSLRIVLTGVFAWEFFRALHIAMDPANSVGVHAFWVPILIYAVAFFTDVLDGFLARTFHWVTPLGKILDPVADKLMGVTALICILAGKILQNHAATIYVVIFLLIAVKELLMLIGGAIMLRRHVVVYADWYGKSATGVFTAGVILTLLSFAVPSIEPWNIAVLSAATAMGFVALVHYAKTQLFAVHNSELETEDEQKLFEQVDRFVQNVSGTEQAEEQKTK